MGASGETVLAIGALAILWLVIAATIAAVAAQRFRLAQQVLASAQANARLLDIMPARPLLVRPDRSIEVDSQLLRDLGLGEPPQTLAGLSTENAGIAADDLAVLTTKIEVAQTGSERLVRTVRANGSARIFEVQGGPAPGESAGTLLLWFIDTSEGEEERAKLALRLRQSESAFGSLTQLIEA